MSIISDGKSKLEKTMEHVIYGRIDDRRVGKGYLPVIRETDVVGYAKTPAKARAFGNVVPVIAKYLCVGDGPARWFETHAWLLV